MNLKHTFSFLGIVAFALAVTPARASVIVTPSHIVTNAFTISGTLMAVDVPYLGQGAVGPVGPDWTGTNDDGWQLLSGSTMTNQSTNPLWEPDGSVYASSLNYRVEGAAGSTYTFDVADGLQIKAIYATWGSRGASGAQWTYLEGTAGTNSTAMNVAPAGNLRLSWTDSLGVVRSNNFQRLFDLSATPLTVAGGNGFTLKMTRTGNSSQADAVIIEFIPEPSSLLLVGLGLGCCWMAAFRRRRS